MGEHVQFGSGKSDGGDCPGGGGDDGKGPGVHSGLMQQGPFQAVRHEVQGQNGDIQCKCFRNTTFPHQIKKTLYFAHSSITFFNA